MEWYVLSRSAGLETELLFPVRGKSGHFHTRIILSRAAASQ